MKVKAPKLCAISWQLFYAQRTLTKSPITLADQAEVAYLLSSSKFSKTTGQIISVDGGLHEAFSLNILKVDRVRFMPKAQLFITCLGDQFYTSTLQNMTRILERLGVELIFPPEQTCCGQPLFNNGFEEKTRPVALNFMHAFAQKRAPIVGPSARV